MNANIADQRSARPELDRQLVGIGWALFLIMIGGIGLVQNVPQGAWLFGTGLIMLANGYAHVTPQTHGP